MISKDIGLSQAVLARIADVNSSTVSRYVSSSKIDPISKGKKKNIFSVESVRKILSSLKKGNRENVKKVHSFYNFKGGTGKTSICFQISTHLALCGYNVLVVDADPQGHLSTLLGFNSLGEFATLYDVIAEGLGLSEVIHRIYDGLDFIPSNLSLTRVTLPLDQMPKREEVIKNIFSSVEKKYDFIIFDTNPTISTLNRNIVVYSHVINIVCETQPLSLNGMKILFEDLRKFFNLMRMKAPEFFIIPNKYEDKSTSSAECMAALNSFYSDYLKPDFAIRKSEDMVTASKLGLPVSSFARKNSNALEDIIHLLNEFLDNAQGYELKNIRMHHG